jgi:hypothetical protein
MKLISSIGVSRFSSDPSIQAQAQTAGVTLFLLKPFSAYRSISAS